LHGSKYREALGAAIIPLKYCPVNVAPVTSSLTCNLSRISDYLARRARIPTPPRPSMVAGVRLYSPGRGNDWSKWNIKRDSIGRARLTFND
jgi:hypothetical protein